MISLRKSMALQLEDVLACSLQSYKQALGAVGAAGSQACPPVAGEFRAQLMALQQHLAGDASATEILETEQQFEKELEVWGQKAANFYDEKTAEVKEILAIVAKAAAWVGERDKRYTKKFGTLTERLHATARLSDLTAIRQSLVKDVGELRATVTQMAKDGEESVTQMRGQLKAYEDRMLELERMASQDELTGLANRRAMECQVESRIQSGVPFSLLYIDLNGFKQVNDTLGHLAGDELLKQFGAELRATVRGTDVVGRWGGDEFMILADGEGNGLVSHLDRIQKWLSGDYSIATESGSTRKVQVTLAIGCATRQPDDTPTSIFKRADAAMYSRKAEMKLAAKTPVATPGR
jgi:diguanylate cyclase (GGDEF)-like protein